MRLEGKIAVVTGGSRGIGRAISKRFSEEGATVIVNYSSKYDIGEYTSAAEELVKEIKSNGGKAESYDADVSDVQLVNKMIDYIYTKYCQIDILVANAGICPFEEFLKIDEELFDQVIGVNLKGAFFSAKYAMKKMVESNQGGRIIFTSSVSSIFGGELQTHYCATKGGINQLMKSIAISAGKYNITSNAVLPGTVITDINKKQLLDEKPELLDYFINRTPLLRLPTPEDIASAILFFASDDAASISGATLIVDGGMSINLQ